MVTECKQTQKSELRNKSKSKVNTKIAQKVNVNKSKKSHDRSEKKIDGITRCHNDLQFSESEEKIHKSTQ